MAMVNRRTVVYMLDLHNIAGSYRENCLLWRLSNFIKHYILYCFFKEKENKIWYRYDYRVLLKVREKDQF